MFILDMLMINPSFACSKVRSYWHLKHENLQTIAENFLSEHVILLVTLWLLCPAEYDVKDNEIQGFDDNWFERSLDGIVVIALNTS